MARKSHKKKARKRSPNVQPPLRPKTIQLTDALDVLVNFLNANGVAVVREALQGSHPGIIGIAYGIWEGMILPGMEESWTPSHSTEIGELRWNQELTRVDVLDLDGDIDEELTEDLQTRVRLLKNVN